MNPQAIVAQAKVKFCNALKVHHGEEASACLWGCDIMSFDLIPAGVTLLHKLSRAVLQVLWGLGYHKTGETC